MRRDKPAPVEAATETAIRIALAMRDRGMRKIPAELGVGVGTVQPVARTEGGLTRQKLTYTFPWPARRR